MKRSIRMESFGNRNVSMNVKVYRGFELDKELINELYELNLIEP